MSYTFEQKANPEQHGLEFCPHCDGYGSSLKEPDDRCTKCNGTGLLTKKEAETYRREHGSHKN